MIRQRGKRRKTHAGGIGVVHLSVDNFLSQVEPLSHDLHVRFDHRFSEPAKLLVVLLAHDLTELIFADLIVLQERGDSEEGAQEGIPLHAQLEILPGGRLASDIETGKDEHPNLVVLDELSVGFGNTLPSSLRGISRFPYQASTRLETFQWVGVGEGLGITTQDHIHVIQLAVDTNGLGSDHQIVIGWGPFLFRTVFGVRTDKKLVFESAKSVVGRLTLGNDITKFTDDGSKVFACGDHPPTADGMKAHRDGHVGQQ